MIPLKDDNPTRTFPFITLLLILMNLAAFVYQMRLGPGTDAFVVRYAAIPWEVTRFANLPGSPGLPPVFSIFTSLFLHGGILHLAGNLLFFWIFANNIEDAVGHLRFIGFYLVCGLAAALVQIAVTPSSQVPMVGASGAVSGIMGAYLILYPRARVLTLVFIIIFIRLIKLPAYFFLFFWFALQVANGLLLPGSPDSGGVAFFAHIGGFITGIVLIKFFEQKRKRRLAFRVR